MMYELFTRYHAPQDIVFKRKESCASGAKEITKMNGGRTDVLPVQVLYDDDDDDTL